MVTLVLVNRHMQVFHTTDLGMNLNNTGVELITLLHFYRTQSLQDGSPVIPQSTPVLPSGYV